MDLNLSDKDKATIGFDVFTSEHRIRGTSNANASSYRSARFAKDASFANYGIFAEWERTIDDDQRLKSGLRLDRWSAEDLRNGGASAGDSRDENLVGGFIRYERDFQDSPITAFAGLGHSQRTPDYWEIIPTDNSFGTSPEKLTQLDVGLSYKEGDLSVSFSSFVNYISDYILLETSGMGMMSTTRARNINALTAGFEFNLEYELSENWKLLNTISYVYGDNLTDDRALAQQPPLEGTIGLQYSQEKWSTGVVLRMAAAQNRVAEGQGNIVGRDFDKTAGYAVLSLNAAYRINANATLSAGIDNLFDTTYAAHVSRDSYSSAISGYPAVNRIYEPGRNAWIRLDFKF